MKAVAVMFLALAAAASAHAGILGWLSSERRNWQFVQDTGGIWIAAVREIAGKKVLPVEYDVSGLTAITRKPTTMNSGLAVRKIATARKGGSIIIQVVTQVVEDKRQAAATHLVDLSDIPPGSYEVFYEIAGDPEKSLGRIELK